VAPQYKVVQEVTGPEGFTLQSVGPTVEGKYHWFKGYWNSKPGNYELKFSVVEEDKQVGW
jgi:hypothetical protein